jgi:hypothetical protein
VPSSGGNKVGEEEELRLVGEKNGEREEEEEEDKKMMAAPVEGLIGLHDADQIPSPFKNTTNPSRCYRAVGNRIGGLIGLLVAD